MTHYRTEQEAFWAGEFGDNYIERNDTKKLLAAKVSIFSKILSETEGIESCIEFGSNIGLNLLAIQTLLPTCQLSAVEINEKACKEIEKIKGAKAYNTSILEFERTEKYQFVFTMGVLIHLNPEILQEVYEKMYNTSEKYILVAEYYNPVPVEIDYRGNKGKLFKRDFAGELMDKYPDLKLLDYGFAYHRDNLWPQDDITWFLMSK